MKQHGILSGCLICLFTCVALAGSENVDWPGDYKRQFTFYFSGDRTANNHQIIDIYANDIALEGYRKNGKLPHGSVLVGELHAAMMDEKQQPVLSRLNRRVAKEFSAIVVMQRGENFDAGYPETLTTGDWEFAVFSPEGERLNKDITGCRACHHPLTDSEFLFSYRHLR